MTETCNSTVDWTFHLPPLACNETFAVHDLQLRCSPSPGSDSSKHLSDDHPDGLSSTNVPFYPLRTDRVITLIMTVVAVPDGHPEDWSDEEFSELEYHSIAFHILSSKLRQVIRQYPPGEEHNIPWSEWGPTCCRAEPMNEGFPGGASSAMIGSHGMRLVRQCIEPFDGTLYSRYIDPDPDMDYPDLRLRGFNLYDFNQAAISHALAASGKLHEYVLGPEDAETVAPLLLGDGYEYYVRPTRLPAGYQAFFEEEVCTGLPYRKHRTGIRVRSAEEDHEQGSSSPDLMSIDAHARFDSVFLSGDRLCLQDVRAVHKAVHFVSLTTTIPVAF